jgi:hypothetical protein
MHFCINPEEIKTEIETLGHVVTDIWNTKQCKTKSHILCFFVELKPAKKNHIQYRIYTTVQNNIQTSQTQKGHFSMCKLSNI